MKKEANREMKKILKMAGCIDIKRENMEHDTFSFFYHSDGLKVKGYVILPKKIKKTPLIFVNRGGTGEFSKITPDTLHRFSFFADHGYTTIFSQYRGVDGGEGIDRMGGDDIFDIINLFEVVKKLPFIDLDNIGMYGVSRGGMMAFQVIVRVPWVKALVTIAPIVDEFRMAKWRAGWRNHQIITYGGSEIEMYKRSPLKWTELFPKNLPILICHGTKDERTDFTSSKKLFAKIKKDNKNCFFKELSEKGHFIAGDTKEASVDWFRKYLI